MIGASVLGDSLYSLRGLWPMGARDQRLPRGKGIVKHGGKSAASRARMYHGHVFGAL